MTETFTRLVDKHHSPLILRKYTKWGFPVYVSIIADNDLSDFDEVVVGYVEEHKVEGWVNDIQRLRNLAGELTEYLCRKYDKTEGVGVMLYVDKLFVVSLFGDHMNHGSCKQEFYDLVKISAHI
jgi:hypothetical protein